MFSLLRHRVFWVGAVCYSLFMGQLILSGSSGEDSLGALTTVALLFGVTPDLYGVLNFPLDIFPFLIWLIYGAFLNAVVCSVFYPGVLEALPVPKLLDYLIFALFGSALHLGFNWVFLLLMVLLWPYFYEIVYLLPERDLAGVVKLRIAVGVLYGVSTVATGYCYYALHCRLLKKFRQDPDSKLADWLFGRLNKFAPGALMLSSVFLVFSFFSGLIFYDSGRHLFLPFSLLLLIALRSGSYPVKAMAVLLWLWLLWFIMLEYLVGVIMLSLYALVLFPSAFAVGLIYRSH